ncbi:hypothetical protein MMC34_006840 [Xylographa carneopallida]|nr:hypothetical protein [Xylographa carneopallida]
MYHLHLPLYIALAANICQTTPIFQEPLRSGLDLQVGSPVCKLPSADWTGNAVGAPWPPLTDTFDLKLENNGKTYRLKKLKPGEFTGVVYQVLGDNSHVIAYAKTPTANEEKNWKLFCNEAYATSDVGQALDWGNQRTGSSADPNPRPWLIVKPMKGTILKENKLFQIAKAQGKCMELVRDKLVDRYMVTTDAYIKTYHWWHHDTNMANAFWTPDLVLVDFIDWGQAKAVVSGFPYPPSDLLIAYLFFFFSQPLSRQRNMMKQSGAAMFSK